MLTCEATVYLPLSSDLELPMTFLGVVEINYYFSVAEQHGHQLWY